MTGVWKKNFTLFLLLVLILKSASCQTLKNKWTDTFATSKETDINEPLADEEEAPQKDTLGDFKKNLNKSIAQSRKNQPSSKTPQLSPNPDSPDAENSLSATDEPKAETPQSPQDIIVTQKQTEPKGPPQKSVLKSVMPPEFKVNAPLQVQKRFGSIPHQIFADSTYVYTDDSQDLGLYSPELLFLTKTPRSFKIKEIHKVKKENRDFLFVSEENHVLEIFEITPSNETERPLLNLVAGFDVGGEFSWLDPQTLLVYLPQKIQFLDFSHYDQIKVIREIPVGEVHDKLILKNHLYLLRGEFLDILEMESYALKATLRLGTPSRFLEATREANQNLLYLSAENNLEQSTGFIKLTLSEDLSGVLQIAPLESFDTPLHALTSFLTQGLMVGLVNPHPDILGQPLTAKIYDIKNHRFLRGAFERDLKLNSLALFQDHFYSIQGGHLNRSLFKKNLDIIEKNLPEPLNTNLSAGLAQVGSEPVFIDEYTLTPVHDFLFESKTKKVILLDPNHMALIKEKSDTSDEWVVTDNLSAEEPTLKEINLGASQKIKNTLLTPFGILYTNQSGQLHLLDVNFNSPKNLNLSFKNLISWTVFTKDDQYILVTVSQNPVLYKEFKIKTKLKDPYVMEVYALKSETQIDRVAQFALAEPTWVFAAGYDVFMALQSQSLNFYSARELSEIKLLEEETLTLDLPGTLLAAKLSPQKDLIYALLQHENTRSVFVFDYQNVNRRHLKIDAPDVGLEHFEGSSFSRGGQLFMLPTPRGTFFFDHTYISKQPESETLKAHWPLPATSIDVAEKGQFVCVSLDENGVYCGDLLFY